jgi:hypothetical protein
LARSSRTLKAQLRVLHLYGLCPPIHNSEMKQIALPQDVLTRWNLLVVAASAFAINVEEFEGFIDEVLKLNVLAGSSDKYRENVLLLSSKIGAFLSQ